MSIEASISRYVRGNQLARTLASLKAARNRLRETTVEQGMKETRCDRWLVMSAMKGLAKAGAGRFVIGRSGYKTRIEWAEGVDFDAALADAERAPAEQDFAEEADVTTADCEDAVGKARAALAAVYNTTPDKIRITVEV